LGNIWTRGSGSIGFEGFEGTTGKVGSVALELASKAIGAWAGFGGTIGCWTGGGGLLMGGVAAGWNISAALGFGGGLGWTGAFGISRSPATLLLLAPMLDLILLMSTLLPPFEGNSF